MGNTKIEQNRYEWVDIAKGIGIILVVYGHVLRGLESADIVSQSNDILYSDPIIYSFHMPLFFILSGLFFMKSIQKYGTKAFIVSKIKTILYPFVIWSLIQTTIEIFLSNYTNGDTTLYSLATCLFYPRAQFWFLYALFFISVINAILYFINKKSWIYISFAITIIYAVLKYYANINLNPFSLTLYHLIYFNIGIIAAKYVFLDKFNNLIKKLFLFILIVFIFCEYIYIFFDIYKNESLFSWLMLPLIGSTLILAISFYIKKNKYSTFLSSIGKVSLEIYILHILCGSGIRIMLYRVFHIEDWITHLIIGTICGTLIPYLFVKYVDKFSFSKYLFKYPSKL